MGRFTKQQRLALVAIVVLLNQNQLNNAASALEKEAKLSKADFDKKKKDLSWEEIKELVYLAAESSDDSDTSESSSSESESEDEEEPEESDRAPTKVNISGIWGIANVDCV